MSIIDEVTKIVKSFKLIDIKTEIKNPTIAPVINYKSPTNSNFNFQSLEINNTQLNQLADKVTDNLMETFKAQIVGTVATNESLRHEVEKIPSKELPNYLVSAMVGTATLSEVQPNFITAGTTVFPKPEDVFQAGYKVGIQGRKINNVRITRNQDNTITISYDET